MVALFLRMISLFCHGLNRWIAEKQSGTSVVSAVALIGRAPGAAAHRMTGR